MRKVMRQLWDDGTIRGIGAGLIAMVLMLGFIMFMQVVVR